VIGYIVLQALPTWDMVVALEPEELGLIILRGVRDLFRCSSMRRMWSLRAEPSPTTL
jgi:hypothetical protein